MELVFNIWFIVDIGTELSKYAIVKPYCCSGNDEEKTELLKNLAETDYTTGERIEFTNNSSVVSQNLQAHGYIHQSTINQYFDLNLDFFLKVMEKKLPLTFKFTGDLSGKNEAVPQSFPDNPLFVQTILMENEYGEIKPYTTPENKEWFNAEKIRIENKFKEMNSY